MIAWQWIRWETLSCPIWFKWRRSIIQLNIPLFPFKRHSLLVFFLPCFYLYLLIFQGICPGNRLKVIPTFETGCYTPSPVPSPCPSTPSVYYNSSILSNESMYENTVGMNGRQSQPQMQPQQKHGKRRSWHIMPNKVSEMWMRSDLDLYLNNTDLHFVSRSRQNRCWWFRSHYGRYFFFFFFILKRLQKPQISSSYTKTDQQKNISIFVSLFIFVWRRLADNAYAHILQIQLDWFWNCVVGFFSFISAKSTDNFETIQSDFFIFGIVLSTKPQLCCGTVESMGNPLEKQDVENIKNKFFFKFNATLTTASYSKIKRELNCWRDLAANLAVDGISMLHYVEMLKILRGSWKQRNQITLVNI